jgi:integrase
MLTEVAIKNLKPKGRPYKVADGRSLYMEVYPNGSKFWRVRYDVDGRETRKSLGRWPRVTLKMARELNERGKFERLNGIAPAKPAGSSGPTVADICAGWRRTFLPKMAPNTVAKMSIQFDKHILPALGSRDAVAVTPESVLKDLLLPIVAAGHLDQAHRIRATLGRVFRFAMAQGVKVADPTTSLVGALAPTTQKHRATILDQRRVGRLMLDIRNYTGGPVVGLALRMLPYVFVRPGELRWAEWGEFDMAERLWMIPAEKMKMRSAHLVPLSSQVVAMLERLRGFTGEGRYLFPGRNLRTKPISDVAINAALRYLGYGRDEIVGHGFRAMASTLLNQRGYNSDWIERQLAHVERNAVRAAYNHAEYWPERCKMMQDWADLLDSLADAAALPGEV